MKYVIIDGNNVAIRSAFANEELSSQSGIPTGVHYGVFQSLITLKEKFPSHQMLVVWDGKSKRRMEESQEGVKKGIIKSAYKENRDRDDPPQPLLDFYEQAPFLKKGIGQTGIPQIRLHSYEADDIAGSYATQLEKEVILVTSDKDYYQLLSDKVSMWDVGKEELITESVFKEKFGISPKQHIDVGALMGDSGDNIFGVPGWGEKTALKAIQEHKDWQAVIDDLKDKYKSVRDEFPDVKGEEFEKLRNIRTPAEQIKFDNGEEWKGKYPEIKEWMPFTGVALAFEEKRWKPSKELKSGLKNNLLAIMFEDRVRLAYSLKKMDINIKDLPDISNSEFNKDRLVEYLNYYDIYSLKDRVEVLEKA